MRATRRRRESDPRTRSARARLGFADGGDLAAYPGPQRLLSIETPAGQRTSANSTSPRVSAVYAGTVGKRHAQRRRSPFRSARSPCRPGSAPGSPAGDAVDRMMCDRFSARLISSQFAATLGDAASPSMSPNTWGCRRTSLSTMAARDVVDRRRVVRILRGEPGVEHDLQQQVAELLAAAGRRSPRSIRASIDLVRLLDQVPDQRVVGLAAGPMGTHGAARSMTLDQVEQPGAGRIERADNDLEVGTGMLPASERRTTARPAEMPSSAARRRHRRPDHRPTSRSLDASVAIERRGPRVTVTARPSARSADATAGARGLATSRAALSSRPPRHGAESSPAGSRGR